MSKSHKNAPNNPPVCMEVTVGSSDPFDPFDPCTDDVLRERGEMSRHLDFVLGRNAIRNMRQQLQHSEVDLADDATSAPRDS